MKALQRTIYLHHMPNYKKGGYKNTAVSLKTTPPKLYTFNPNPIQATRSAVPMPFCVELIPLGG